MNKPVIRDSFSVDDIHKIREYHYETTKNMTRKQKIDAINKEAEKFEMEMKARKAKRVIV